MISVECSGRFPVSLNQNEAFKLVKKTMRLAGWESRAGINLSLVDDKEIRKLNRQWRGINKPTDVLSFNYPKARSPVAGKDLVPQLGDIVISMETVRRQAKLNKRTIKEELAVMIVHGCLHLLGFDHDLAAKEKRMFRLQHDILISSGIF